MCVENESNCALPLSKLQGFLRLQIDFGRTHYLRFLRNFDVGCNFAEMSSSFVCVKHRICFIHIFGTSCDHQNCLIEIAKYVLS